MSGIGFWELIIVFLIGLIVLGPERLPRVASQLGSWLGQARRMTRVMKRQLEDEMNLEKDFHIRPPRPSPPPAPASPREEYDDTYSAAHDAGSVGTGVSDHADADGSRKVDELGAQSDKDTLETGKSPVDSAGERGKPMQLT